MTGDHHLRTTLRRLVTPGIFVLGLVAPALPLRADTKAGPGDVQWATLVRDLKSPEQSHRDQAFQRLDGLLRSDAPEDTRQAVHRLLAKHCEELTRQRQTLRDRVEAIMGRKSGKARERALARWSAARDEALRVILDETTYPKADHGKAGQPQVNQRVAQVREAFRALESLELTDIRGLAKLAAREAAALVERLDRHEMLDAEARAYAQRQQIVLKAPLEPTPPAWRALLLYRAGRCSQAREILSSQAPDDAWSGRILARLELLRLRWHHETLLAAPPGEGRPQEAEVRQVTITNDYRYLLGRAPLEIDPGLTVAARAHSREMAQLRYFNHFSPTLGLRTPGDRCRVAGYQGLVAENIHAGRSDPQAAHDAFFNSSGHHRILLGTEFRSLGVGQFRDHWTQNFGSRSTFER